MSGRTVAIIGAGATGCACAVLLSRKGVTVHLYNRTPDRLNEIRSNGGITVVGGSDGNGDTGGDGETVPISMMTTRLDEAVAGADLVHVMTPATAHRSVAAALAPNLRRGQAVLISPGSCGSLEFARVWRDMDVAAAVDVLLGESAVPPRAARVRGPARLTIKLPSRMRMAAFPGCRTRELCERTSGLYEVIPARNVLDAGLNNPNFLIHPVPMVLNYAAAERADGFLSLMNEGMTPGVLRAMDAFDRERMEIVARLGLPVLSVDDIYNEFGPGPVVYRSPGEPMGFRDKVHARYLDEDVPFGSMFLASLGDLIGVDTPIIDATNTLACAVTGKDYWQVARTCDRLGLAGMSARRLMEFADEGA